MKRTITKIMIYLLTLISLTVAIGLMAQSNMWRWIVAYWVTLTIKNIIDWFWE